jgi:hypothetical protein
MTRCLGIPAKEFVFTNSSFVWTSAQAKNYYFQAFCDNGKISDCTNVNLTSSVVPTSTSTTISTTSTTTYQKPACPYECCVGNSQYLNRNCLTEDEECVDNQCVFISTTTTTTEETVTPNPPEIPYSLIGGIVILIIVLVFAYYFLKGRKPTDKWSELYQKYGRR